MMLLDKARENAEEILQLGYRALEEARRVGTPAYYLDPEFGDDIIREFPDGTRERIISGGVGQVTPVQPRAVRPST